MGQIYGPHLGLDLDPAHTHRLDGGDGPCDEFISLIRALEGAEGADRKLPGLELQPISRRFPCRCVCGHWTRIQTQVWIGMLLLTGQNWPKLQI